MRGFSCDNQPENRCSGNRGEIMEKLRGELWEGRAVDGKLKSNLEWPIGLHQSC